MHTIKFNLPLIVEVKTRTGAECLPDVFEYVECISNSIVDVLGQNGFKSDDRFNPISRSVGKYSLYLPFDYKNEDFKIELLLTIIISNEESNSELDLDVTARTTDALDLDKYSKRFGLDTFIYVATKDAIYCGPFSSVEQFENMLSAKLSELKNWSIIKKKEKHHFKHNKKWAKSILSRYDDDTIAFVRECKDYVNGLIVLGLRDNAIVELSNETYVKTARLQYEMIALNEGHVEEDDEFGNIYEAICILDK